MKSAVETLNPTRVRLTVEVPFEELKPSLDAAYKKIGGQVNVPGFRKGKVPPQVIDQRFGRGMVLEEAVNSALPGFYAEAVKEAEVDVLGQPEVDVKQFADGQQLEFTAEVDVRPSIELPEYRGIEVTVEDAEVTDADIETQLVNLQERFAAFSSVERPAATDDHLSIDLSGKTKDGELIEEAQATGLTYVVGSGSLVEGLDEAVIGLSVGEEKTFASKLVAGDRKDEEVDITVTVQAVKVRELPEIDDEFAQTASPYDTADELKADLAEQLTQQKLMEQAGQARDKVLQALLAQVEVPLPDAFLQAEVAFRKDSINQQLQQAGLTLESYLEHEGQSTEEFEADVRNRAEEAMRTQFVLDEIVRAEKITVTQDEVTQHLVGQAQRTGMNPEEFAQQLVKSGNAGMLVAEVVRGKALGLMLNTAVVTDASGRPVDLSELLGEGEDDAEAGVDEVVAEAVDPAPAAAPASPAPSATSISIPTIPGS